MVIRTGNSFLFLLAASQCLQGYDCLLHNTLVLQAPGCGWAAVPGSARRGGGARAEVGVGQFAVRSQRGVARGTSLLVMKSPTPERDGGRLTRRAVTGASLEEGQEQVISSFQNGNVALEDIAAAEQRGGDDKGGLSWVAPVVMLNFVAMLWGTQHSVIKMSIDEQTGGHTPPCQRSRKAVSCRCLLSLGP